MRLKSMFSKICLLSLLAISVVGIIQMEKYVYKTYTQEQKLFFLNTEPSASPKIYTINKRTYIQLGDQLTADGDFTDVYKELLKAKTNQIVILQLNGVGGYVSTVQHLINALKTSKATIEIEVLGNVYSGHAMLAVVGNTLKTSPGALFMFHTTSGLNMEEEICAQYKNTTALSIFRFLKGKTQKDRGIDAYKKCLINIRQENKNVDDFLAIHVWKYLSDEELKLIRTGHDVYIDSENMQARKAHIDQHGRQGYEFKNKFNNKNLLNSMQSFYNNWF